MQRPDTSGLPRSLPPRWGVRRCGKRRDDPCRRAARRRRRGRTEYGGTPATRRLLHEVRRADPVSSRVFKLARTAGHPSEIAGITALPGAKPSWVTVSLTTPWPTSSMSKATLERASARQVAAVASSLRRTSRRRRRGPAAGGNRSATWTACGAPGAGPVSCHSLISELPGCLARAHESDDRDVSCVDQARLPAVRRCSGVTGAQMSRKRSWLRPHHEH